MKKTILMVSVIASLACISQSLYAAICTNESVCSSSVTGSSYEVTNASVAYGTASFSSVLNGSAAVNFGSGNAACSDASFSNSSYCISDPDTACTVTLAIPGTIPGISPAPGTSPGTSPAPGATIIPAKIILSCSSTTNVKVYGDKKACLVKRKEIKCS